MNGSAIFLKEIEKYDLNSAYDQELAASELLQKMILASLGGTDFFSKASFHGGTALRVLYGLNRYSQDLDFTMLQNGQKFSWKKYLINVQERMKEFGCTLELYDKSNRDKGIVIAEIRDLSIGRILNFEWAVRTEHPKKIMVKLEINRNPPAGGKSIEKIIDFPFQSKIRVDDLPTLFAGKCHALLCRDYGEYIKGRDWYDFLWYVEKNIKPNYTYLSESLNREGNWKGQNIKADLKWFENAMKEKISNIDFDLVKKDVIRFISITERNMVSKWDKNIFLDAVKMFHSYSMKSEK